MQMSYILILSLLIFLTEHLTRHCFVRLEVVFYLIQVLFSTMKILIMLLSL